MNFPCRVCVVDAICIDACSNLKGYLNLTSFLDRGYNITSTRLKRFSNLASTSIFYRCIYTDAYKRFIKEKK